MGRHHDGTPIHALWGIPAPRRAPDSTTTGRHRAVRPACHHLEDTEHEHDRLPEHLVTGRRQHAAG